MVLFLKGSFMGYTLCVQCDDNDDDETKQPSWFVVPIILQGALI